MLPHRAGTQRMARGSVSSRPDAWAHPGENVRRTRLARRCPRPRQLECISRGEFYGFVGPGRRPLDGGRFRQLRKIGFLPHYRFRPNFRAEFRRSFYYHDCSGRIPGHTTRAPPVGFEPETSGFQLYAIANLDKTSVYLSNLYLAENSG